MELTPASGKPAVPVPVEKMSTGWRQVTVRAPEGSFAVRAADDAQSWLAFTWPRELAAGGYFARRFAASGAVLMIAGLLGLLAGIAMSLNKGNVNCHEDYRRHCQKSFLYSVASCGLFLSFDDQKVVSNRISSSMG